MAQMVTVNQLKRNTKKTTELVVDVFNTIVSSIAADSDVDVELATVFDKAESDIAVIKATLGVTNN